MNCDPALVHPDELGEGLVSIRGGTDILGSDPEVPVHLDELSTQPPGCVDRSCESSSSG